MNPIVFYAFYLIVGLVMGDLGWRWTRSGKDPGLTETTRNLDPGLFKFLAALFWFPLILYAFLTVKKSKKL